MFLERITCQWHVDRPYWTWNIEIGTQAPYYILVLAKPCQAFVPIVSSGVCSEISISIKLHRNKTSVYK